MSDGDVNPLEAPAEVAEQVSWVKAQRQDSIVVEGLAARLVGVEVEGGKLLVPPVTDATILGHLLVMHVVRWDGVTVADAKVLGEVRAADVKLSGVELHRAYATHERLHLDIAGMRRPHWHRDKVPA